MAKTREIIDRRQSVQNIRKITRTMEMISTSRFRKAHQRILDARPYGEHLYHLLATMMSWHTYADHPLLSGQPRARRQVVLVMTSHRGLCGGYNANIMRLAMDRIWHIEADGGQVELWAWGKKGLSSFRYNRRQVDRPLSSLGDRPKFRPVEALANELMDRYTGGELSGVDVVSTNFESAGRYNPLCRQLLPLRNLSQYHFEKRRNIRPVTQNVLMSPPLKPMLDLLIPAVVRQELFQCFIDAYAAEQSARMRAMKAATDNAEQMIEALSKKYNRLRQSQITGELLDILGGAEALG